MGQLVEGTIPQIFNGVSRQPHSVRFPGQVQEAENVAFSVETGGFAKRLGTRIKKKLTGLATGQTRKLHIINRDASERYRVVLSNGSIKVFDEDYVERTVTADASSIAWLNSSPDNFVLLSALDYTFIAKKTDRVALSSTVAPNAPSMAVYYVSAVPDIAAAVGYRIFINGAVAATFTANISTHTTTDIAEGLKVALASFLGAPYQVSRSGSFILVKRIDGTAFTTDTESPRGDTALVAYKGSAADASKAPARAIHGMMMQIKGVYGEGFWIKFVAKDGNYGEGYWQETVSPGTKIAFNPATMPRALRRNSDGTFTLGQLAWSEKKAGGDTDVPPPDFVGETVSDLVFIRNRFGIVAGETVYFSAAGDYFNFWPETSTELLETDPFGLTNTTNSVSRFYFAVPFRRSTFIMGDNAQFEIGGPSLSATQASIDLATSYAASSKCRPVALGDELYFPAETGKVAAIMSYVFEEASVSETANDVSKHVEGYIPSPVVELVADPIRGQLACLSASTRDTLYIHKFYYQGDQRVQSAWGAYSFKYYKILSIGSVEGVLNMLVEFNGFVWLMELPNVDDIYGDYSWTPRLDHHQFLTGVYDAVNDRTTWTLPYDPVDPVAITSNKFPTNKRMLSLGLKMSGATVSADGNWTAFPVMIGENFDAWVELSRQFLRDGNGTAIVSGRLQMRTMTVRYSDTGYFTVEVTPVGRETRKWTMSGRVVGSLQNRVQNFNVESGTFRFGVQTGADSAVIRIGSDKFMPFSITSAVWVGYFNEITRQG